jgi:hypothetical protein
LAWGTTTDRLYPSVAWTVNTKTSSRPSGRWKVRRRPNSYSRIQGNNTSVPIVNNWRVLNSSLAALPTFQLGSSWSLSRNLAWVCLKVQETSGRPHHDDRMSLNTTVNSSGPKLNISGVAGFITGAVYGFHICRHSERNRSRWAKIKAEVCSKRSQSECGVRSATSV